MQPTRRMSEPDISAEPGDIVKKPQDWDKVVACAYLRLLGHSREKAAEGAGAGERSLFDWEHCSWWKDAEAEAKGRWLRGLASKARNSLETGVGDDANLALKVLERLDDDLAPPKNRHEVGGEGGGPLEVVVTRKIVKPDATG